MTIILILMIICIIWFITSLFSEGDIDVIPPFICICLLIALGFFISYGDKEMAYKQGQVDAINGKVKYELVKQPDGTTEWKEKKVAK